MSASQYVCEICGEELRYHGGPHAPRWCAEHRQEAKRQHSAERERQRMREHGAVPGGVEAYCELCFTRLLLPAPTGLCGFCEEETR